MTTKRQVCHRCGVAPRLAGIKYCKECKKAVLMDLRAAGYLQRTCGRISEPHRTADQKENIYETKHGRD